MKATIFIKPNTAPRQVRSDSYRNPRKCVLQYRAYQDELRLRAAQQSLVLSNSLTLRFFLPLPPSWSGKRKTFMEGAPHQQRPDLDNLIKAFVDSLVKQDCTIWSIKAEKFWSSTTRIEIET